MSFLFRFFIGGFVVCVFASLADILKPKTFAGIFSAAPSVALATLALAVSQDGKDFAGEEAGAMIAGAGGFLLYAATCLQLIARFRWNVLSAAVASLAIWFGAAAALWLLFLR